MPQQKPGEPRQPGTTKKLANGKELIFPNITRVFDGANRFPAGHVNATKGWTFTQEVLSEAAAKGQMLTADLDMLGQIRCRLNCIKCFNPVLNLKHAEGGLLSDDEIRQIVLDAKSLGLRSVKIIGPGEPLEAPELLGFLEFLANQNIIPLIFTKGVALGNERTARKAHGIGSMELAQRLDSLNVSILFGADSFDSETQTYFAGLKSDWYVRTRNDALELIEATGFNRFVSGQPTRLALIFNPLMRKTNADGRRFENIDEAFEVYRWARERNVYPIISTPMVAGKCASPEVYGRISPTEQELLGIWTKINLWAIGRGIYTIESLEREGISPYAGALPCQQVGAGPFIRRDGVVLRCPGDDISIIGRLGGRDKKPLAEIWAGSENLERFGGMINCRCPPKEGKSLPQGFFEKVLDLVREGLKNKTAIDAE